MRTKLFKKIFFIYITAATMFIAHSGIAAVSALSEEQKKLLQKNILYYDLGCSPAASGADTADSTLDLKGKKVFMVGDSITYTASLPPHNMKEAFKNKGVEAVISGTGGSTIDSAGPNPNGDKMSGLEALEHYKKEVDQASAVIVAHGTNHFPSEMAGAIRRAVDKIKKIDSSVPIFWVNTLTDSQSSGAYSSRASKKKNRTIEYLSSQEGYSVIDITKAGIKLNSDKIHPEFDESGIGKWRDTIIETVTSGSQAPPTASLNGDCSCGGGSLSLSGNNNTAKALGFFVSQGFTPEVAAGIVGNFIEESNVNPRIVEGGGESDTVPPPVGPQGQPGYGIAQWTSPGRKENLKKFAQQKGMPVSSLELQLLFVMEEMKQYPGLENDLKNIKGSGRPAVEEAALLFHNVYEGSADTAAMIQERVDSGVQALQENGIPTGGGSGGGCASAAGTGEVIDGVAWPVPKKWWDSNPEYFTAPHHDYPAADIPVPTGTEVYSMLDGKVVTVESSGACGNGVIIDSSINSVTVRMTYCHGPPGSVKVNPGDRVTAGQQIMVSNETGSAQGTHLHLQVDVDGTGVCPQNIFKNLGRGKGTNFKELPAGGCIG